MIDDHVKYMHTMYHFRRNIILIFSFILKSYVHLDGLQVPSTCSDAAIVSSDNLSPILVPLTTSTLSQTLKYKVWEHLIQQPLKFCGSFFL